MEALMKNSLLLSIFCVTWIVVTSAIGCGGNSAEGTSGAASCDASAVESSFADSCAAGLADVFTCWNPSGNCQVSGLTTTYANGASLVSSLDQTLQFRGPSDELCGTATTMISAGAVQQISFLTRGGETYQYEINVSTSEVTIVCPGGMRVTIDSEQAQAVQGCNGTTQIGTCDVVAPIDPNDIDPNDIGNVGSDCTNDSQCPDSLGFDFVCCQSVGACLPKLSCDLL